jgi:ferredoxin
VSTTYIAMILAILAGFGLLIGIGALSLLSGALNFLFVKPKIQIIKTAHGDAGFAFTFKWDQDAQPVTFDKVRIHLFNPFGSPTEVDITREFDGSSTDFVRDMDMGDQLKKILTATTLEKATIEIEVTSSRDNVTHKQLFKADDFVAKRNTATETADDLAAKFVVVKEKPLYTLQDRSFISPPLPKTAKQLKMASNPMFAGDFAGAAVAGGAVAGPAVENFTLAKVWIEPGCIVCDACEAIFPEVFEVTDSTCLIRPGAPLNDGLKVQEAAEACPVEVIKFTKAS